MKNKGLEIAGLENDGLIKVQRLAKVGQDLIQLQPTTDCHAAYMTDASNYNVKLSTYHHLCAVTTGRCCGK